MKPPKRTRKETRLLMGMPITVEIAETAATPDDLARVFAYFGWVDETFSTYKATSEVSRLNRGELAEEDCSDALREVLRLGERTREETAGYFEMWRGDQCDPTGIVKGWAIRNAAELLRERGFQHFYVDAGGDAQIAGTKDGARWRVGIRNPFNRQQNVKVLALSDCGVATSGTAVRGQHIYNPFAPETPLEEIVSLTVIGPDVLEADRFATAAFAMGRRGIEWIAARPGLEAYMIDAKGIATYTSGFERYVAHL